jgi:hypothetical protein
MVSIASPPAVLANLWRSVTDSTDRFFLSVINARAASARGLRAAASAGFLVAGRRKNEAPDRHALKQGNRRARAGSAGQDPRVPTFEPAMTGGFVVTGTA